jgi:hypothetical protein
VQQGAIILGIGGDNSNGAIGRFYEGVITKGYSVSGQGCPVGRPAASWRLYSPGHKGPCVNHVPATRSYPSLPTPRAQTDAADDAVQANIAAAGYGK